MSAAGAFEAGTATHVGKVRRHNEDLALVRPDLGIFAVADGMGGHADGALASRTVVEALQSIGRAESAPDLLARLEDRIIDANRRLTTLARERGSGVIGSTVAVLLAFDRNYACLWAGDSRIYLVRGGRISQVSRDHSEVQELFDRGLISAEEARTWPRRNIVTRAIGVSQEPELDLVDGQLESGDRFVICSDGLTAHVADNEILDVVDGRDPQDACDALVALTLERGASDNVTVVTLRYRDGADGGEAGR
ncbi:MAG TPA: protein phosphatase 2C domain-containing protein [Hyphomicrobiales bacterium]|nr:protein phosphatase 2C domain-containing protein [Hyphomicrobiales bacterium]